MADRAVEILAIGAGPSNLALACAIEELAPPEVAGSTLVVEKHESVVWQRGMLLPWTRSQVSFLKDLVTLRNPRSKYSFVNFLHSTGRLDDFVNMGNFLPFRLEISAYLAWVAQSLTSVQMEYGKDCVRIAHDPAGGDGQDRWLVEMSDGSTVSARNIVIGTGRDARIPPAFRSLSADRLIHSTEYSRQIAQLDPEAPHRVVVIGAAESAVEMLWETYQRFPKTQCTLVIRSPGLDYYQTSKFTNELYFPSYTDRFYAASEQARQRVLAAMRLTNYAAVTPEMLDTLFQQIYLERLTGTQRLSIVTMSEVVSADVADGEVVLTVQDHMHDRLEELHCDVVLLGTGFEPRMPWLVRGLMDSIGVAESEVSRAYRMSTLPSITAGCYLQGVNETTHGIADSLISVLAIRSGEIVEDILAHRAGTEAPLASEPDVAVVSAKTGLIDGALAGATVVASG